MNYTIIDSLIKSLPIKLFLFNDKEIIEELKSISTKNIFISFNQFKKIFYDFIFKYDKLLILLNQTLEKRAQFKSKIIITFIIIILNFFLFFFLNKIYFSFYYSESFAILFIYKLCFFTIISFTIFQILKLISLFDSIKHLYSVNLSEKEKKLLNDEFFEEFEDVKYNY